MVANLFSRVTRFLEKSQVMAAHWSIALNDESSVTHSVSYLGRYRAAKAAKKDKSLKHLSSHVLRCPTCFFSGLLGVLSPRREPRKNTKRKNPFIFLGEASQKLSASICNNLISKGL